jgi:glycosyltransferase involved in cell wall biosynthesis
LIYAARFYAEAGQTLVQPAYGMYVEALAEHADELVLCGPVSDRPVAGSGFLLRSPNVRVVPLPYYERDVDGVRLIGRSIRGLRAALEGASLASIMLPLGLLGPVAYTVARSLGVPVCLHVVGDLREQWSPSDYGVPKKWIARGAIEVIERVQQMMIQRAPTFVQGKGLQAKHHRPGLRLVEAMETTINDRDVRPRGRRWSHGGPISLLYAGNLIRPKGVHVLLESLRQLRSEGGEWHLTVAGAGPQLDPLREQAKVLKLGDHVEFAGFQPLDGVLALMDRAKLFVFPSFGEGMPRVLLEALARGLPVVISDVGGVSGLIEHGRNGWLVPPGDPEALSSAIRNGAADPSTWERVSEAGLETAREHTMDHYARVIVEELEGAGLWKD